ncbi:copper chaperone PCu(A)C [Thiohalocapsa sp. ML1]|jgi:periplasmic copper chaperone A|uniref:copper chaperone PCu(A)C n=1 Tax=Thiohalocapsa sp. ML1 TaxID=1431688 RepID=UPI000731F721|nr:copper chaperone PCu(A)C [Thiohalocapsa sp. ML1]
MKYLPITATAAAALLGALVWFSAFADPLVADAVRIEDPYARAVPPGQPNSAVFMVIENTGPTPVAVVAAESPAAATVELHTHRMADGMMQMRRIERIELPAGESVALAPGGLHVMLIGLTETLAPGMEVPLTLVFDDGGRAEVTAPVRHVQPMMQGHEQH